MPPPSFKIILNLFAHLQKIIKFMIVVWGWRTQMMAEILEKWTVIYQNITPAVNQSFLHSVLFGQRTGHWVIPEILVPLPGVWSLLPFACFWISASFKRKRKSISLFFSLTSKTSHLGRFTASQFFFSFTGFSLHLPILAQCQQEKYAVQTCKFDRVPSTDCTASSLTMASVAYLTVFTVQQKTAGYNFQC